MERDSASLIIQATQIKTHDVISPTAQNGHPPKDFGKIKCRTGGDGSMGSSHSVGRM